MSESNDGIMQADVRDLWPSEPYNFTPWLAENLELLGEAVGLKLELVQQEKLIGSMYLDILAREFGTDTLVAIENQLEWSDTDHMGRLLMYAAGCEAKVVIWVASQFMFEHAQVLHQLNEWAGSNARFYGVKVQALRKTENADLEPRFLMVAYPGGWDKEQTLPPVPPPRPEVQQHQDFFAPLIAALQGPRLLFADKAVNYFNHTGRFFPSRVDPTVGYAASFSPKNRIDHAWVTFNISLEDNALTKQLYDALEAEKDQIQSGIGAVLDSEWQWDRYDRFLFSSISMYKAGSIDDPPDKLEETRAWMLDMLPKLKGVFEERVESLLTELRTPHGNGPEQP